MNHGWRNRAFKGDRPVVREGRDPFQRGAADAAVQLIRAGLVDINPIQPRVAALRAVSSRGLVDLIEAMRS